MKRILIIQRTLTHYRKKLFDYIESRGEFFIDVVYIGQEDRVSGRNRTFKGRKILKYKNYEIKYSKFLIEYIKHNYKFYDFIILEGTTNFVNNIPICSFLMRRSYPYIIWDAGRRKNAKMTLPRKLIQKSLEFIWNNASAIMAYSTLAKQYFIKIGIMKERVFICQNTLCVKEFDRQIKEISENEVIDIRRRFVPEMGKIVLYVGAIEPRKRIQDLIDAFEIAKNKYKGICLVIIGGGSQLEQIKKYIKYKDKIFILGQIIDEVILYFLACDLFVLPSEGGLSLNQAMICRKPVIASSADGTEADLIIDGKNGFLFHERDIQELANKIVEVLNNEDKCSEMGIYSREIIDSYANEEKFYDNLKKCLSFVEKRGIDHG